MLRADANLILILGALLLGAGSLSMLVVKLTSRGLRGVGSFSLSFAAGMFGAAFQLVPHTPILHVLGTDLALLSSFAMMHLAILQLAESPNARLWHGAVLLGIQAVVDVAFLSGAVGHRIRITSLGLLIAVQAITTISTLLPLWRGVLQAPVIFSIALLTGFTATDLARSLLMASGQGSLAWNYRLGFLTFALYLSTELGMAFGFFWMTTSNLTAQVEHLASTDPLTRVYNRRNFLKWCHKELLRSQRSGVPFSVLMMDLDHFKRVNDTFGHQRGDEVLCAAVERMQDSVRGIDVLCRWGGEEFAVLLPNANADSTLIVAERIRENVQRMELEGMWGSGEGTTAPTQVTISIGTATYSDLDDNVDAMLSRADRALYRAKDQGRNRVLAAG